MVDIARDEFRFLDMQSQRRRSSSRSTSLLLKEHRYVASSSSTLLLRLPENQARMSLVEISFRIERFSFARLYFSVELEIDSIIQKFERLAKEKNRTAAIALNAEVRRTKAKLLKELPKLHKLALKKT